MLSQTEKPICRLCQTILPSSLGFITSVKEKQPRKEQKKKKKQPKKGPK